MNIPERQGENCCDIVYDLIENELKISTQDIRFHAVHRVGKPAAQNVDNSTSTQDLWAGTHRAGSGRKKSTQEIR